MALISVNTVIKQSMHAEIVKAKRYIEPHCFFPMVKNMRDTILGGII